MNFLFWRKENNDFAKSKCRFASSRSIAEIESMNEHFENSHICPSTLNDLHVGKIQIPSTVSYIE